MFMNLGTTYEICGHTNAVFFTLQDILIRTIGLKKNVWKSALNYYLFANKLTRTSFLRSLCKAVDY